MSVLRQAAHCLKLSLSSLDSIQHCSIMVQTSLGPTSLKLSKIVIPKRLVDLQIAIVRQHSITPNLPTAHAVRTHIALDRVMRVKNWLGRHPPQRNRHLILGLNVPSAYLAVESVLIPILLVVNGKRWHFDQQQRYRRVFRIHFHMHQTISARQICVHHAHLLEMLHRQRDLETNVQLLERRQIVLGCKATHQKLFKITL